MASEAAGEVENPFPDPAKVTVAPPHAFPDKPIDVEVRAEAQTRKGETFVRSGETLRSGDRLALHVKVSEPAYVYVGLTDPQGKNTVIPASSNMPFAAGTFQRVPQAGQWFRLARNTGREEIFVYASRRQLTPEQSLRLLREDSARSRPAPKPHREDASRREAPRGAAARLEDPPESLSATTRTILLEGDSGADIQMDEDLTKAHLVIHHRK